MRKNDNRRQEVNSVADGDKPKKIDIIEERLVVGKDKVETGKVVLHKRVIEEDVPLDLELIEEHMDVEVKKIGVVVDKPGPPVRDEGDTRIYSVYREVYVKQTILEEEVRITKKQTTKPFHTSEKLRREVIDVERISGKRETEGALRDDRNENKHLRENRNENSRESLQGDDPAFNQQGDLSGYEQLKE